MNDNELTGWQKLCKRYGSVIFNGKKYVWDFASDKAVIESEMSAIDVKKSNKAKWDQLKADAK